VQTRSVPTVARSDSRRDGWSPILELRQYTLRPGARDVLIDLFDSELVEPQEDAGMDIIGQFRDLDRPDRFVWLRGFTTMPGRAESLAAFYGGPVWKTHSAAANATMIASDDVLLLRPAVRGSAFALARERRPPIGSEDRARGLVAAVVTQLEEGSETYFERVVAPAIARGGGSILGSFVTEPSENTFPALPVRENERVFVWFAGFPDLGTPVPPAALSRATEVLRLAPTSRSLLHGGSPACAPSRKETP
jgi:hypothetical protein